MIGIIFSNSLNTCPFIDKYLDVLERNHIEYEVILWNRDGDQKEYPDNYRVLDVPADVYMPKWKKIGGFYQFRKFVLRTVAERKYDKLIFLTTLTAVMCYDLTQTKYRNRYIFDFRDLGFEQNPLFRCLVEQIIKSSSFTCMSSPAFADVFGVKSYTMAHNFRYKDLEGMGAYAVKTWQPGQKINLLHIGITRGEEYNKRIADVFGNDERFEVSIVGRGNDTPNFVEYARRFSNIVVKGTYSNEDKASFIENADMLLYYYPCDFNCNRALANKYYDGLIYRKPLVGNIRTYSGQRIAEHQVGISIDLDRDNCADEVYAYYSNMDLEAYLQHAQQELETVLQEDAVYIERIEEFVCSDRSE